MVKTLPKILSVLCAMVLLFVVNTRPLCVSAADTPDLTLVESDYTASEVAELIAGVDDAVLVVILIITGFVALTYITLRNVDAPIQFSSTDSFFDKCQALGQYMLDNIDDNVKDVIYSVYEFVTAGSITSISSVPKLNLTTVGTFFAKIGAWLGGSFVSSVNTVTQGLFGLFDSWTLTTNLTSYAYTQQFSSVFNDHSSISYSNTFGYYTEYYYYGYSISSIPSSVSAICLVIGQYYFGLVGLVDSGNGYYTTVNIPCYSTIFQYSNSNYGSYVSPSLSSYNTATWTYHSNIGMNDSSGISNKQFDAISMLTYLSSFGLPVYGASSYLSGTVYASDLQVYGNGATTSTSSDTVTVPLSDELVLQIADVAVAAAAGTIATTKDYYDELIAGLALTITSALSGSNFTMPEGDYYIPSLDNIWKYVEYMFSTLGSWIIFAGKCIGCVTVGEGGLSWIFYGGFIFLICGGIVGKILLG